MTEPSYVRSLRLGQSGTQGRCFFSGSGALIVRRQCGRQPQSLCSEMPSNFWSEQGVLFGLLGALRSTFGLSTVPEMHVFTVPGALSDLDITSGIGFLLSGACCVRADPQMDFSNGTAVHVCCKPLHGRHLCMMN